MGLYMQLSGHGGPHFRKSIIRFSKALFTSNSRFFSSYAYYFLTMVGRNHIADEIGDILKRARQLQDDSTTAVRVVRCSVKKKCARFRKKFARQLSHSHKLQDSLEASVGNLPCDFRTSVPTVRHGRPENLLL